MKEGENMYLDPGFGGMLLQIIIAMIAVSGATLFAIRKKLKGFFGRKRNKEMKTPQGSVTRFSDEEDIIDTIHDEG